MRDIVVKPLYVAFNDITGARIGSDDVSQSGVSRAPLTESMRAGQEVCFKDRFERHAQGLLHDPILDRGNAQRAGFRLASGLGDIDPLDRQGPVVSSL